MNKKLNNLTNCLYIFKKGFNFSQDGPGNRLVYHLQGCNFKCKWCTNPESMAFPGENSIKYQVGELVDGAVKCRPMFFEGGGVTLTGGEPTYQFENVLCLLKALKKEKINTAMETNGSHKHLFKLIPYIDNLIMDFKHFDEDTHILYTGHSLKQTKENLKMLSEQKIKVLIRTPVINGINADPYGFANYFSALDCKSFSFELLPYHEFGKAKWREKYEIQNGFITKETLDKFKEVYANCGLNVIDT